MGVACKNLNVPLAMKSSFSGLQLIALIQAVFNILSESIPLQSSTMCSFGVFIFFNLDLNLRPLGSGDNMRLSVLIMVLHIKTIT